MIRNFSTSLNESLVNYPINDSGLSFTNYIGCCRAIIAERRLDLHNNPDREDIITANCPYELIPEKPILNGNKRFKYGVLLIHGLLDGPFSLKDIGIYLQQQGMLCRSILLPGHGTRPADLNEVSYQHWIQAVQYGLNSLKHEVDQIILVGFSTGAALAVHQALNDAQVAGIVMLAPAIRIKAPTDMVLMWHKLLSIFKRTWTYKGKEIDFVKYRSLACNAVTQLVQLTKNVSDLYQHRTLSCPIFMAVSREDETICSDSAIDFFTSLRHPHSELLLYTSWDHRYPDDRIITRSSQYDHMNIKHFSHVSIPFAPHNSHYGQHGNYQRAAHSNANCIYGAYNLFESIYFELLYKCKISKKKRRELTFNPDFDFMADQIVNFIFHKTGANSKSAITPYEKKKKQLDELTGAIVD